MVTIWDMVMARVQTKKGDVFSVKIDEKHKKYFQLITYDLTQLNSDVIRAFKKGYPLEVNPDLSEIIKDDIDFYAHCVTKWGVKMGYWEKVGNSKEVGSFENVLFRISEDSGSKVDEEPIKISEKWYIWKINDNDFTWVGKLEGNNKEAEIGSVIPPPSIVHRMQTGKYDFVYPDFE